MNFFSFMKYLLNQKKKPWSLNGVLSGLTLATHGIENYDHCADLCALESDCIGYKITTFPAKKCDLMKTVGGVGYRKGNDFQLTRF